MKIEFDPNKNNKNIEKHNISFEAAVEFDFESAFIWQVRIGSKIT
jgi:uncharacterized DUF497 family protein